ncbi:MAG: pyruvate formate lyase family protein [Peptococcaceae bacterium]|jgi:formate C-acetyltransferase|nr:pyruvate formate lyase family protein [Peptococcaceae bacterium]MDH7526375.1 pyruvate formate lyase family protein [Peptococcaceae bacterium]
MGTKASDRVVKLRKSMVTRPEICVERGYLMTQSYQETEGQPEIIRRAKALEKVLKEMTIGIEDGELIVGRGSSKLRAGILTPELNAAWYAEERDLLSTRTVDRFKPLTEEEKAKIKEIAAYWKGRSLFDKWKARVPEEILKFNNIVQCGGAFCGNNQYFGHSSADYEILIKKGIKGIKQEVEEELAKVNLVKMEDLKKYYFLKAVNITLDAALVFVKRYAELAESLAAKETDEQRKLELKKIAETCSWVPLNPARNFYEALQSTWFGYLIVMIEGIGPGNGFGRVDQYLYPFYKKDIEEGNLTPEAALELIELFLIKANGLCIPYSTEAANFFAGFSMTVNFVLGGLTKDGKDAVNELSYIFLEAEKEIALSCEDIIVRISKKTPDAFVIKACELANALKGKVKFLSDETVIKGLMNDGKPAELARQYIITGCNTPTVPGYSLDVPGGMVNLPLMLDLALNNGVARMVNDMQVGPPTGDARKFKSFGEVWDAFKKQVEALIPYALVFRNVDKQLFAEYCPVPFQSIFYHNCIKKGLDCTNGGTAPYIAYAVSLSGIPNVGDALAAIKKVVFEDKKIV